jgi:hypothetical protein
VAGAAAPQHPETTSPGETATQAAAELRDDRRPPTLEPPRRAPCGPAGPACWTARADLRIPSTSRTASTRKGEQPHPAVTNPIPLLRASLSFLVKQPGGLGCKLHSKCSKCAGSAAAPPLHRVPGFWGVGYGRTRETSDPSHTTVAPLNTYTFLKRSSTHTLPPSRHVDPRPPDPYPPTSRSDVTLHHTHLPCARVFLPAPWLPAVPHSLTRGLFFRVPLCGVHCAAASRCRHLHACAAGHASHSAQMSAAKAARAH